jgi:hypothetical protein
MMSWIRFPVLPWEFSLAGEDHGLDSLQKLGLRPLLVLHAHIYHHSHQRDNVTAPYGRPKLRSRLHFGHKQEGGPQSLYGHVVALGEGVKTFWALLAHPQEVLNKRHLVYCYASWLNPVQPTDITHSQYTKCRLLHACYASWLYWVQPTDITCTQYTRCHCEVPPEDEQVMLETCRGP